MHRVLARQLRKAGIEGGPPTAEQWARLLERVDRAYTEADQDRYTLERALELSSEEMRERFKALRETRDQLVRASRRSGMADVAATVLHNVGNVLNSVNVSANVVAGVVRASAGARLGKALTLLAQQPKPGRFLDEDPRGQKMIDYLGAVDRALAEERATMEREIEALAKHLEHMKAIVLRQLSATKALRDGESVDELVEAGPLLDDGVAVLQASLPQGSEIVFVRDYESVMVETDRHKLFEIVMNLLSNARDAVVASPAGRVIAVRTKRLAGGEVAIEVEDDGVGIAPDVLAKVFEQGFTTKATGNGYGLHSAACSAMELGGRLSATSDGPGRGARFVLALPKSRGKAKEAGRAL